MQDNNNHVSQSLCKIVDKKYSILSHFFITRRLCRAEITGFYILTNNVKLVLAKNGIFRQSCDDDDFHKVFDSFRGSKPLNLCVLPNNHIFFGEYFQNIKRDEVHVYSSVDSGLTWNKVYSFSQGNINHIHGIFYDKYIDRLWIVTGDMDDECIIGYSDDEFKTFHVAFRGGQEYRSCQLFFYKDFIVYATDSPYIENEIKLICRKTMNVRSVAKIQGSVIKGGQTGNIAYVSTAIEPSSVNKDNFAHIWLTNNGIDWKEVYKAKKDYLPFIFQFGTFEFPINAYNQGRLWFSGRALKGHDNKSFSINV